MAKLSEKLETGARYLRDVSDKAQETAVLIQNGKEVLSYWGDSSKREAAQREIEKIKRRGRWLVIRSIILWGLMIFVTWKVYGRL